MTLEKVNEILALADLQPHTPKERSQVLQLWGWLDHQSSDAPVATWRQFGRCKTFADVLMYIEPLNLFQGIFNLSIKFQTSTVVLPLVKNARHLNEQLIAWRPLLGALRFSISCMAGDVQIAYMQRMLEWDAFRSHLTQPRATAVYIKITLNAHSFSSCPSLRDVEEQEVGALLTRSSRTNFQALTAAQVLEIDMDPTASLVVSRQASSLFDSLDVGVTETCTLIVRLFCFSPGMGGLPTKEAKRRLFVDQVLVGSLELAAMLLRASGSPAEILFDVEMDLNGVSAYGPLDYGFTYRGFMLMSVEAKQDMSGVAQCLSQLAAIRESYKLRLFPSMDELFCKTRHYQVSGLDVCSVAVLTDGENWQFFRRTHNALQRSDVMTIDVSASKKDLERLMRPLMSRLAALMHGQALALNAALASVPPAAAVEGQQLSVGSFVPVATEDAHADMDDAQPAGLKRGRVQ